MVVVGTNSTGTNGLHIHRWNGTSWTLEPGGAISITAGPNGEAMVVNAMDQIYTWSGRAWLRVIHACWRNQLPYDPHRRQPAAA